MKYFVFFLSLVLFIATAISLINIDLQGGSLSRFGYGYITGKVLLLLVFLALMFFSGRSIYRKNFSER
ncbi:MAG TPA: hypothetical protein VHE59_18535 [Mucilaginibacter sp.]|nr:hypothetical protein [Bacteroidota bacterium]HVS94043.1 hypothetical protein [Mucilaginibacter sp.]